MDQHLTMIPAIFDFSSWHLLVLLVIMLLLFGSRLPQLMRNLGSSVNEFKKGMENTKTDPAATPPHAPEGTVSRTDAPPAQTPPANQNNLPPKT